MAPIRRITLTEAIIKHVIDQVREGELKPGDRLPPEKELAEQLDVSRPVVRESLRSLSAMNVINIRPGSGAVVQDVQEVGVINPDLLELVLQRGQELKQLHEARTLIESALAGWAAQRATDDDWQQLEACVERLKTAKAPDETYEPARHFHLAIAHASQNPILAQLVAPLYDTLRLHLQRRGRPLFSLKEEYEVHQELLDILKLGDPEQARQAMHRHLEISYLRWFDDQSHNGGAAG